MDFPSKQPPGSCFQAVLGREDFLKSRKKDDTGREAMGPQKKVMRNELGEEAPRLRHRFGT